ncbi:hypothetical protein JKP88DRAFT_350684 [Tribonema minus]|uniref:Uncharacterized protein n=1 Tax=Tribonema minus TaxID=303371 RepID=A0A835YNE4_9STRA|nr:hypothetical protein JKP88DRAFT_350684 [Tribonema minus]
MEAAAAEDVSHAVAVVPLEDELALICSFEVAFIVNGSSSGGDTPIASLTRAMVVDRRAQQDHNRQRGPWLGGAKNVMKPAGFAETSAEAHAGMVKEGVLALAASVDQPGLACPYEVIRKVRRDPEAEDNEGFCDVTLKKKQGDFTVVLAILQLKRASCSEALALATLNMCRLSRVNRTVVQQRDNVVRNCRRQAHAPWLEAQLSDASALRERVTRDLVHAFVPVLNAKKARIRELAAERDALEEQLAEATAQHGSAAGGDSDAGQATDASGGASDAKGGDDYDGVGGRGGAQKGEGGGVLAASKPEERERGKTPAPAPAPKVKEEGYGKGGAGAGGLGGRGDSQGSSSVGLASVLAPARGTIEMSGDALLAQLRFKQEAKPAFTGGGGAGVSDYMMPMPDESERKPVKMMRGRGKRPPPASQSSAAVVVKPEPMEASSPVAAQRGSAAHTDGAAAAAPAAHSGGVSGSGSGGRGSGTASTEPGSRGGTHHSHPKSAQQTNGAPKKRKSRLGGWMDDSDSE